jgi:hypothetical protein
MPTSAMPKKFHLIKLNQPNIGKALYIMASGWMTLALANSLD